MNDTIALERLAGSLHDAVPQIRWPDMDRSRQVIRGVIDEAGYKLVLGRRGQFGLLGCYGISNVEPVELMEVNSALSGPLRLVQRSPSSNPHVSATWPLSGAVEAQAQCLAPDIQRLVVGDTHLPRDADSIDPQLRRWIKDLASAQDHLADVPSNDGGCVFTIGGGPTSLQISCLQRQAHLVAVSTLAANWVANTRCERNTACRLLFMLNARLRWTRLVLRETAIKAEVTLPVAELNERTWKLLKQALVQAVKACRETLRVGQLPDVAAAFERMHDATHHDRLTTDHVAKPRKDETVLETSS